MSEDADLESMVSVFASDQPHELGLALDTLGAASIPAVSARSKFGFKTSRGGRFDAVYHVYVPAPQEAAARAALEALPFPARDGPDTAMSTAEFRRGNRIMVIVLVVFFLWGLFVIFADPQALFAPLYRALQRLLG